LSLAAITLPHRERGETARKKSGSTGRRRFSLFLALVLARRDSAEDSIASWEFIVLAVASQTRDTTDVTWKICFRGIPSRSTLAIQRRTGDRLSRDLPLARSSTRRTEERKERLEKDDITEVP